MNYLLNLKEVTYALSEALDYVGIDDTMHGKRVAYMSAEIAKKAGWSQERIDRIIFIGMLHDCGVSSTDVHHHLVTELDWDNSQAHCIRGEMLLQKVPLYHDFASVIFYHHTHWDELPQNLEQHIKEESNLIYLTDRVDALRVQIGSQTLKEKNAIAQTISKHTNEMFSPELAEHFLALNKVDSFWYFLEAESLEEYFSDWIKRSHAVSLDFDALKGIAQMFANIVDAKSTFTAKHTHGVAAVARFLAQKYGLSESSQEAIELASYFHDLGKLRVADAILHKNAPLDEEERSQMNRHGFDSNIILRKIRGFEKIAQIASMHHEMLDGDGYPYHLHAEQIPTEARVVAVADIFQALVQNRPYRLGLSEHEALDILKSMQDSNKLDGAFVTILQENLATCYALAMEAE